MPRVATKKWDPQGRKIWYEERKHKSGSIQVYECYSYYENGKNLNNKRYMGLKNPETGEVKKVREVIEKVVPVKSDFSYGYYFVMNSYIENSNFKNSLKLSFKDDCDDIITLALSMAFQGSLLYKTELFQNNHYNNYSTNILTSQKISELLKRITFDKRNAFFREWIKSVKENEYLAYDITSISSYSSNIDSVELGYNRDREKLAQINLGLLHSEESKIPVYYNVFNGSIRDVSTIKNLIDSVKELGIKKCKFVMDKGFYSKPNNNYFIDNNYTFSTAIPFTSKWIEKIVSDNKDIIGNVRNYSNEFDVYSKTIPYDENGRKANVHLYYDVIRKANEEKRLNRTIQDSINLLTSVKNIQEGSNQNKYSLDDINAVINKNSTYMTINRKTIDEKNKIASFDFEVNDEAVKNAMLTKGFLAILSNDFSKDSNEMLRIYRLKEVDENAFDDIKNLLDAKRLNVKSEEALQGKIFLVFLSLILTTFIRNEISKNKLTKNFSYDEVVNELAKIKVYTFDNDAKMINPITAKQRSILSAFSITEHEIMAITTN